MMMTLKRFRNWLWLPFLALSLPLSARMAMGLRLNAMTYMQYEEVYACVTLRNDSGRPLAFGSDPMMKGFLLFDIRDRSNKLVPKRPGMELEINSLLLRPGETKPVLVPLRRYYQLDQPGSYAIRAYVSHAQLNGDFQSPVQYFRVETGSTVWTRTVGLPDLEGIGSEGKQEERTYSIRVLTAENERINFLFIENKTHVIGVVRLGKVMGKEPVSADVDMLSRIHLLVPLSPKVFHYLTFSLDGGNAVSKYYRTTSTIPSLIRDSSSGRISVAGGVEARPGIDFVDPAAKKMTARQMLDMYDQAYRNNTPGGAVSTPREHSGLVDLGSDL